MNVATAVRSTLAASLRPIVTASSLALAAMAISIGFVSGVAHADTMNWDAVAQCESGGDWAANTGNGHFGGLQFKQATWSSNGGYGSPAGASRAEQIRVAENVLQTQGVTAWPKCGALGGSPAMWNMPTAPSGGTGCAAIRPGGILGIFDLRQMCSTFLAPLMAFGAPR